MLRLPESPFSVLRSARKSLSLNVERCNGNIASSDSVRSDLVRTGIGAVAWSILMGSRKVNLQEDTHFRVLRLLEANPEMSQRELADAVGVSTGSVYYLLRALVERGLIKIGNFSTSADKRRYAYILTPKGIAEKAAITGRFLSRKRQEYEALRREISDLESELGRPRKVLRISKVRKV